jgi:hypothetical protein
MYSKNTDIDAVLKKASKNLDLIEEEYKKSLTREEISVDLLVDIKDFFGNLRSALDYSANKIPTNDGYFPICNSQKDFDNRTLGLSSDIKNILSKWQPYNDNPWIHNFSILNNKSKHLTLIPQKRKEIVETRVSGNGGSVSWGNGVTFGQGVSIMGVPINPVTQLPVANNTVKTEKITWVHFTFDNSVSDELHADISALPFIKECFEKITKIISEVETL